MPVYEYECDECQKVFEVQQRIADAPVSECPECSGHVRKLISRSSFQLKGGGWCTDGYNGKACGKGDQGGTQATVDSSATPSCPGAGGSCCQCPSAS